VAATLNGSLLVPSQLLSHIPLLMTSSETIGSGCWQNGWQAPEQSPQALTGDGNVFAEAELGAPAGDGGLDGVSANESYLETLYGYDRDE
jgi:hypothetical protein